MLIEKFHFCVLWYGYHTQRDAVSASFNSFVINSILENIENAKIENNKTQHQHEIYRKSFSSHL